MTKNEKFINLMIIVLILGILCSGFYFAIAEAVKRDNENSKSNFYMGVIENIDQEVSRNGVKILVTMKSQEGSSVKFKFENCDKTFNSVGDIIGKECVLEYNRRSGLIAIKTKKEMLEEEYQKIKAGN